MHTCEYCEQPATVDWNTDEGLTQVCDAHGTMIDAVVCGLPWNAGKASNADTVPSTGTLVESTEPDGWRDNMTAQYQADGFFDRIRDAIANLPDDPSGIESDGTP